MPNGGSIWDTPSGVSPLAEQTMMFIQGPNWQCHRKRPVRCHHAAHLHHNEKEGGCDICECAEVVRKD